MGLQKVAFNFMVECGGKLAKSLLCTKPQKAVTSIQGLKYKPLYCDVTDFSNITIAKIKNLHKGDFYKAMTDKGWMPEMSIFKLSDKELLNAMKNNDYKTIQNGFSHEAFHCEGLKSYLEHKGLLVKLEDKNIINQALNEYSKYEKDLYKTFDDYLFPLSKNKKCYDIERELAQMGISVRLTEHENMADDVYRACLKMRKAGIKDFPNIRIEAQTTSSCSIGLADKNIKEGYVILGTYKNPSDKIFVNDTLEGTIYHETAHCLNNHFNASDSMLCFNKQDEYFKSVKEILKKYVSVYASNNPNEACSEIFCGLLSGKKYPKEVIDILEHYKATKPNL